MDQEQFRLYEQTGTKIALKYFEEFYVVIHIHVHLA